MNWIRGHWQLFALTALLFSLWNTDVIWPLRMLIVLFHELSHGLAAIVTGGEVVELELSRYEGGVAWTRGGSYFWIASAGYLGSLLIGVALFVGAVRTRADKAILTGCGVLILLATALYIREGFTLVFCIATGCAMIAVSVTLPARYADLLLRVIGLSSRLSLQIVCMDLRSRWRGKRGVKHFPVEDAETISGSCRDTWLRRLYNAAGNPSTGCAGC